MRGLRLLFIILASFGMSNVAKAHINPEDLQGAKEKAEYQKAARLRADCAEATAQVDQNINNVRSRLLNGGDCWWDLNDGIYVVPNVDINPVSALFAGSVWLGGISDAGTLKIAAQTYRQGGNDYWPGPLIPDDPDIPQDQWGTIQPDTCLKWDRFFRVMGDNIRLHRANFQALCGSCDEAIQSNCELDAADIPLDVLGWPAAGNRYFEQVHGFELPDTRQGLAGFWDCDLDGRYDPTKGDYPIVEVRGCDEEPRSFPDEMFYWIYNDNGGIHTETQGEPIRMEVQVQAFAYSGNDELNDMTFQRYKLINRAPASIDSAFFAMWVDPDLGCYQDDYVGCNVERSLAYVYNADNNDQNCGGVFGYGLEIPMLGVDYFRGPLGPKVFGPNGELLNPGLGQTPDTVVELGMTSFTYFNNAISPPPPPETTDPQVAIEFYRYLSGSWRDGTRFTDGGSGFNPGSTDFIDYAFTDNPNDPNGWSMSQEGLAPGDRRTVQATGPFRLDPGAVNELIIGAVWVPNIGHPNPDPSRLFVADEIAQNLFNACFVPTDGPDAPDVDFIELDQELIAVLTNDFVSNNYNEAYQEPDLAAPSILPNGEPNIDTLYKFEGYKFYQLASPFVTNEELNDPSRARLIFQADKRNGISSIFNWTSVEDPNSNETLPVPELKVEGADQGIRHTIRITTDQFATGNDNRLINHRKYYFRAVSYAHNDYYAYDAANQEGQSTPYIEGRRNIQTYAPIPRKIVDRSMNAFYGVGPVITRLDGVGAGGQFLDLAEGQREAMLQDDFNGEITYQPGEGPLDVKIYNPLDVKDGNFLLRIVDEDMTNGTLNDSVYWVLLDENTGQEIYAERTIEDLNEQIIAEYGFSLSISQTGEPFDGLENNGAIGIEYEYANPNGRNWLTGLADDVNNNFIKTGEGESLANLDPNQDLSTMGDGFFVPFFLADNEASTIGTYDYISPAWMNNNMAVVRQKYEKEALNNVDIVFTSDTSLWSRCVIVETAPPFVYGFDGLGIPTQADETTNCDPIQNFDLRGMPSVGRSDSDNDGKPDPDGDKDPDGQPRIGMGWFPGYAVDVETGKRLNIFFGENSTYSLDNDPSILLQNGLDAEDFIYGENTRDMLWNPNDQVALANGIVFNSFAPWASFLWNFYLGGQHYVYVTKQEYDACEELYSRLKGCQTSLKKVNGLVEITWTIMPLLAEGQLNSLREGLIPNDLTVKIRVDNSYNTVSAEDASAEYGGYPTYRFNFTGVEADLADSPAEYDSQLDAINVSPNPYFANSYYEINDNSTVVKITNLPPRCDVTIYSLDGRFIRQYRRDESPVPQGNRSNPGILQTQVNPAIEWDLKNSRGIPVASGVYLIHVDAGDLGERVLKWFGVNRQFDATGL